MANPAGRLHWADRPTETGSERRYKGRWPVEAMFCHLKDFAGMSPPATTHSPESSSQPRASSPPSHSGFEKVMPSNRGESITANIAAPHPDAARSFYCDILGLEAVMDHGWIMTFAAPAIDGRPQVSIASEGGSGAPVPDLSIEVDNLEEVQQRVNEAGLKVEYGPTEEPWGVKRFYVRDPFGRLVNVLSHCGSA